MERYYIQSPIPAQRALGLLGRPGLEVSCVVWFDLLAFTLWWVVRLVTSGVPPLLSFPAGWCLLC